MIEKASPVEMRKVLEIVNQFKLAGIGFVPIPIVEQGDKEHLHGELLRRLETLESLAIERAT